MQEIGGVEVDGFYGRKTEYAVTEMLRHFDVNTAHELFDYLGDYHHIAVERAPEEKRPALDVIYETPPWLRIALKDEGCLLYTSPSPRD